MVPVQTACRYVLARDWGDLVMRESLVGMDREETCRLIEVLRTQVLRYRKRIVRVVMVGHLTELLAVVLPLGV